MHAATRKKPRSLGQIVVIFAISVIAFVGLCAIVIDVSWFWANSLRIQRAADAAALAGVIRLPADMAGATTLARAEAKKNGYDNGINGVTVTPVQDPINHRRLKVTVTADIGTFFARVLGLNSFHTSRSSKAEYVLPVPMGSPENYYGIFGMVRHCATTTAAGTACQTANGYTTYDDVHTPTVRTTDTGWLNATAIKTPPVVNPNWTTTGNVYTSDNNRATTTTNNAAQNWGNFGITFPATVSSIDGIELNAEVSVDSVTNGTACTFTAALSWDNGTTYTTGAGTGLKSTPALTATDVIRPLPTPTGPNADKWNKASWTASQMNDTNFRVRITAVKATTTTCAAARIMRVDHLRIKVYYRWIEDVVTNPAVFHPDTAVAGPQAQVLTARGFWGMMLSQGAETISGDAYLPFYDTAGSGTNANYDTLNYYNYAIDMAAGSTGGSVWIYDPGFCAGALGTGVGDTWISGSGLVSTYYDLYDTLGTPYDLIDDVAVAGFSSGTTFYHQNGSDPTLNGSGGSGIAGCDANHLGWYQLGTSTLAGGATGHVYRLHTSTTDPTAINDQKTTQARNGWALFTKVTGGTAPKIYGIGAMEMYTPLTSPSASEFYLAQIEAAHAGKTMEIKLFDAGDTNGDANIQILIPTTTGWTATNFNYTASVGTTKTGSGGPSACGSLAGTNVPSVTTYASGSSRFNGCWITIQIPIPTTYTAPQTGWWKIRYNMTGSGSGATDITTWQVQIRGNPVHLILP